MSANDISPTALIADESASWRALVATVLREHGWTVVTSEGLPEPAPAAPYDLLVIEPAVFPGGAPDVDRLAPWARRIVQLTYLDPSTLPTAASGDPRLLGLLQKSAFHAGGLLALVQPRPETATGLAAASGPKVLVVEDDVNWRALYEEILGDAGWACYCAVSYGEARGWLQRLDFEIAIVDLNLASSAAPEGNRDGFHLLRAAR